LRHLDSVLITTVCCLAFGVAAAAQSAQPKLVTASKPTVSSASRQDIPAPASKVVPPGSTLYVAKRGDSIVSVAHHFISQTTYLTSSELTAAIRAANGDLHGTFLKAGQEVIVPGILEAPIAEKSIPLARDFEVRAVYLTGLMAASDRGMKIIRRWREVGGNAVVSM
jgi:hypothetical protein